MTRATVLFAAVFMAQGGPGAEACGDKFLRVGRGARYQRAYVAVHPATILLLARPGSSVAASVRELEPALKRAGHKPVLVEDRSAVAPALSRERVHIVLADLEDASSVEGATQANGRVDFLPLLNQPTPAVRAAAEQDYRCVAETPGKKAQVLAEIDELMEIALKGTGETNRKKR
jgi:hypothetical protein